MADNIIVLNSTGHIAEQGNWDYLRKQEGIISKILMEPKTKVEDMKVEAKTKKETTKVLSKALSGPTPNDIADLTRRTGDVRLYKYYASSFGWVLFSALIGTVCLNTFATIFPRKCTV